MPEIDQKVKDIKKKYEKKWLSIKGIEAVGIGLIDNETIGIIISVSKEVENIKSHVPEEIEGIRICLQLTGEISAFPGD